MVCRLLDIVVVPEVETWMFESCDFACDRFMLQSNVNLSVVVSSLFNQCKGHLFVHTVE